MSLDHFPPTRVAGILIFALLFVLMIRVLLAPSLRKKRWDRLYRALKE
jgi:hypothetical protein